MFEAYVDAMRRSFDFTGRMSRADFWCHQLFTGVFCLSAALLDGKLPTSVDWHTGFFFTLCVFGHIPSLLAAAARRLHDVDKTGWVQLFHIVPAGSLYVLYLFLKPSDEGANRFGRPPGNVDAHVADELADALSVSDDVLVAGIEKLEQLSRLRAEGVVDEEEYQKMRARILEIIRH